MKIVVLAAGTSTEREVSIVSGTNVCKALRSKGHQAILVDVFFGKEGADSATAFDGDYDVDAEAAYISSFNDQVKDAVASGREFFGPGVIELCKAADVVFMALHGANGEDGRVQAYFDLCGIPYTGTGYLSSAMAMDKGITKKIFLTSGVPTPRGVELKKGKDSTNLADHNMELPVVVKTCCGGSSVGVYITKTPEEYEEALQGAFSYEDEVVVEEYIEGYPIIEITPVEGFYDYKNKYSAGATIDTCPAVLTEGQTRQMQAYAEAGCKALAVEGYARLDFLMKEDGSMYCLEANTLPGHRRRQHWVSIMHSCVKI